MTRRTLAFLPMLLWADESPEAWDVVAALAAALADENADAFLKLVDPKMAGFDDLSTAVQALVDQADVRSVITPLSDEATDAGRTLQVDWELRLKPKRDDVQMQIREQAVTVKMRREKKRWRVVEISPVTFFNPPAVR